MYFWTTYTLSKTCAIDSSRAAIELQKKILQKFPLHQKFEHFVVYEKVRIFRTETRRFSGDLRSGNDLHVQLYENLHVHLQVQVHDNCACDDTD